MQGRHWTVLTTLFCVESVSMLTPLISSHQSLLTASQQQGIWKREDLGGGHDVGVGLQHALGKVTSWGLFLKHESPAGATEVAVVPPRVRKPHTACLTSVLCVAHSMWVPVPLHDHCRENVIGQENSLSSRLEEQCWGTFDESRLTVVKRILTVFGRQTTSPVYLCNFPLLK